MRLVRDESLGTHGLGALSADIWGLVILTHFPKVYTLLEWLLAMIVEMVKWLYACYFALVPFCHMIKIVAFCHICLVKDTSHKPRAVHWSWPTASQPTFPADRESCPNCKHNVSDGTFPNSHARLEDCVIPSYLCMYVLQRITPKFAKHNFAANVWQAMGPIQICGCTLCIFKPYMFFCFAQRTRFQYYLAVLEWQVLSFRWEWSTNVCHRSHLSPRKAEDKKKIIALKEEILALFFVHTWYDDDVAGFHWTPLKFLTLYLDPWG